MTKNLTEGSPAKLILFFTLPLLAGNIMQQLFAFVDTLVVGRFLGVDTLASVGSTGSLMFLMLGFVIGFASGLSIYTGQRFGAGDMAGVRQSAAACIVLSVLLTVILTVLGVFLARPMLLLMQTPAEILDGAYSFIAIIYGGIVAFIFIQLGANLVRALGDSKGPMLLQAAGLGLNIVFEPVVIVCFGWGIPGAALATIAAQLCGNVLFFFYIRRYVPQLHITRRDFTVPFSVYKAHLSIALPMAFQGSIIAIGAVILQVALNGLGPAAVASYSASQRIESIAMMPMMSFGIAMAAYTAQNFGAKKPHRIVSGVRSCAVMSVGFSFLAGAFLIVFGSDIMHLFVGDGHPDVIAYGQQYLTVNGVTYWILSLLFIFRYTLQGLGDSVVPTIAGVMELIMRSGASFFLCGWLGYLGACLANPMAWAGSCIPLAIAFFWRRKGLLSARNIDELARPVRPQGE